MLNIITAALNDAGIKNWRIRETETHSAELFFIRRALDTRRVKDVKKYSVTVFNDFEKNGRKMRGASQLDFVPSQSKEEIEKGLKEAYFAASFAENPFYELPGKQVCAPAPDDGFSKLSAETAAMKMADAVYRADRDEKAFINTLEMFAVKSNVRIVTSAGTDVSYAKNEIKGEFVVQCKQPQDVEIYHSFAYDGADCEALNKKASEALRQVSDRASAEPALPTGKYDVILSEGKVAEILSYYVARASVQMIYPGYSTWKIGDEIQSGPVAGEKLDITLLAKVPYSSEGIPMTDICLAEDGKLRTYHGGARLSYYLNIPPTGEYNAFSCGNGTVPFEEMKRTPYLYPVAFSDFQMDAFSGHFGGEIRLAYYFDGKKTRIITGGSINGSITGCDGNIVFSKERYSSQSYRGPFAVRLSGVMAAGTLPPAETAKQV